MSKTAVIFLIFASSVYCQSIEEAELYRNEINEKGYSFSYKTRSSERSEDGNVQSINGEDVVTVQGSYNFISPDGRTYRVDFVADENGYRPKVVGGGSGTGIGTRPSGGAAPQIPPLAPSKTGLPTVPYVGSVVIKTLAGGGIGKR